MTTNQIVAIAARNFFLTVALTAILFLLFMRSERIHTRVEEIERRLDELK